jgi:predicted AAA+ superfamily ATPase
LSFPEFLKLSSFAYDQNIFFSNRLVKLKEHFREYLEWGGFPELVREELKIETLNSYVDLTIYKDLIERYRIKNYRLVKNLIKHLLTYYAKEFSVNAYFKIVKRDFAVSRETISDYVSYLEDANFVFFVQKFDYSLKNQELSLKKSYISDL